MSVEDLLIVRFVQRGKMFNLLNSNFQEPILTISKNSFFHMSTFLRSRHVRRIFRSFLAAACIGWYSLNGASCCFCSLGLCRIEDLKLKTVLNTIDLLHNKYFGSLYEKYN